MEKLKLCPFCGGEAMVEDWTCAYEIGTSIRCSTCGAAIHEGIEDGNGCHDRAVKTWNRRTEENPKPLTIGELQEMDGEPVYVKCLTAPEFSCWGYRDESSVTGYQGIFLDNDYGTVWLAYRTRPEGSGEE